MKQHTKQIVKQLIQRRPEIQASQYNFHTRLLSSIQRTLLERSMFRLLPSLARLAEEFRSCFMQGTYG